MDTEHICWTFETIYYVSIAEPLLFTQYTLTYINITNVECDIIQYSITNIKAQ